MAEKRKIVGFGHANIILETMKQNAEERGYAFDSIPGELYRHNEWSQVHCRLETKDYASEFQLQQMPGCCAFLTVSYLNTNPRRDRDVFDSVLQHIEAGAFDAGFASLCLTQVVPAYSKMLWSKEPWIKCLDRKYKHVGPFINAKSGNLVVWLIKDLEQKGKRQGLEVPIFES